MIGCIYRSPSNPLSDETKSNNQKINELIEQMSQDRTHVLITGDFNFPGIDWVNELSPREEQASNFMESIRNAFLCQHVTKPTHYRSDQHPNTLDLVFTCEESMIEEVRHEAPLGKSHHQVLCFKYKCYSKKDSNSKERYCFAKGDYNQLRQSIGSKDLASKIKNLGVAEAWDTVKSEVLEAIDNCIPKTSVGSAKTKPLWMNPEAMKKLKKKKQAYKQ